MDFVNDVASLGYIVHHKCYIDTSNVFDPNITLNFENLELLCLDCHNIPPNGVHFNPKNDLWLKRVGQAAYEKKLSENGVEDVRGAFIKRYGKSYL